MKYISRIDSDHTHCWTVRLRSDNKNRINGTFTDGVYGGKNKALKAAKKFRDAEVRKIPLFLKTPHELKSFPVFRSKGYFYKEIKRDGGNIYKAYVAFCYDKFEHYVNRQEFSFKAYGGDKKARKAAIQFRNRKRLEIEKYARSVGLEPSWA